MPPMLLTILNNIWHKAVDMPVNYSLVQSEIVLFYKSSDNSLIFECQVHQFNLIVSLNCLFFSKNQGHNVRILKIGYLEGKVMTFSKRRKWSLQGGGVLPINGIWVQSYPPVGTFWDLYWTLVSINHLIVVLVSCVFGTELCKSDV